VTAAVPISLEVNGERVEAHVLPRVNLADFLREHLKLTGTHVGCEHGVCGACTVRVNGEIVRSCLMLAVQTHGASVETIEGSAGCLRRWCHRPFLSEYRVKHAIASMDLRRSMSSGSAASESLRNL